MLDTPQLDAQALAKLNLDMQPFLPPEHCEDYFVNTALSMLINGVCQQLTNHGGIQVIKGELGIGKTSFCHRLLCDLPAGITIDLHKTEPGHTINALLQTLAGLADPGAHTGTQELAVQAANRVFRHLFDRRQPALLIDDAHLLTAKTLQTLFKFLNAIARQNYGQLKLILVGERKVDETLGKIDPSLLNPDDIFNTLLRPLPRPDIEQYIRFRLERAGANQPMPLTQKQLAAVQSDCGGLPGKINRLACETLNVPNGNFPAKKSLGKLFLNIALPAVILAPLVFWLSANRTADSPPDTVQSTPADNNNTEILDANPATISSGPGKLDETGTGVALSTSNSAPDNRDVFSTRAVKPEPAPPPPAQVTGNIIDHTSSESWLATQPRSYYMIQLAGTWNLETLRAFSRRLELAKTLVFHQSLRNGQTWYVLLYGPFPDYAAAQQGISELPPEVQSYNPWVRPVAALKKTL